MSEDDPLIPRTREGFKHVYTLEPGDKWCCIESGYIIIANPDKIPFTINLRTGERKDIVPNVD